MPVNPNSKSSEYTQMLWDKALQSPNGMKVYYAERGVAFRIRFDCYKERLVDRAASKHRFPKDDLNYGKSAWDGMKISLEQEGERFALIFKSTKTSPAEILEIIEL